MKVKFILKNATTYNVQPKITVDLNNDGSYICDFGAVKLAEKACYSNISAGEDWLKPVNSTKLIDFVEALYTMPEAKRKEIKKVLKDFYEISRNNDIQLEVFFKKQNRHYLFTAICEFLKL